MTKKLLGLLFALLTSAALAADVELRPDHPDEYVVVKGDTLWDISAHFLRDPWLWPEIWQVNPQVANPHLIYPGDVLTLVYVDGKPRLMLRRGGTAKLSPRVRSEPLLGAIPTIPLDAIRPFLSEARVVTEAELDAAPYIVAPAGEHLITGAGDRVYVRGLEAQEQTRFNVFRKGGPYVDPDTGEVLGFEAIHVGLSQVERFGDPATLQLARTVREALEGDRLLPLERREIQPYFTPRAPDRAIDGHIISVYEGVTQIGQHNVVVLDRGARDGVEEGHVLAVYQAGEVIEDRVSPEPEDTVRLPDERAGVVLVFRTFERVSFGLVMRATRPMHVLDLVRNP